MATLESVIQKINLLIEDANDTTGSLHNNLRDAVDSLILGYGGYGNIEVDSLSDIHLWSKHTIPGTVTETKVDTLYISGDQTGIDSVYEPVDYADEYDISNGKIVLVNPTENLTFTSSTTAQVLLGKYIQTYEVPHNYATAASPSGKFYRIDSTADIEYNRTTYPTTSRSLRASPAYRLNYADTEERLVGIVVSDDINAYPQNGEQGGYKYVYNGTLGDTSSVPVLQSKSVIPSETAQTVTPDSGYDGLSSVSVAGDADLVASNIKNGVSIFNVTGTYEGESTEPALQYKSVTPSAKDLVVMPDSNYDGLSHVTVNGDADLVAENIKKGVSIFGVTGSYEVSSETIIRDAIEADSLSDLHAWKKYTIADGSVVETPLTKHVIAGDKSNDNAYVDYADTYSIVDGEISLDNPSSAYMYGITTELPVYGKYIYSRYQNAYYYVPDDAIITHGSDANGSTIKASKVTLLTCNTTGEFESIVVSGDSNAYPMNGEQGGYKYVYNGTLDGSGGGFTVTDDGAGNVTITSSAITDNNGNVVIA